MGLVVVYHGFRGVLGLALVYHGFGGGGGFLGFAVVCMALGGSWVLPLYVIALGGRVLGLPVIYNGF